MRPSAPSTRDARNNARPRKAPTLGQAVLGAAMAVTALVSTGCQVVLDSSWSDEGNGYARTETRLIPTVREIAVNGEFLVDLAEGAGSEVVITADENLLPYLDARVIGGRLEIGWSHPVRESFTPTVTITVPRIAAVEAAGGARVRLHDRDAYAALDLEVSWNSSVDFFGIASDLHVRTYGSGRAKLGGYTETLEGRLDGYGSMDGADLLCDAAHLRMNGGYAAVSLLEGAPLEASIDGPGHLEWWGWPSFKRYELAGEARVTEHLELLKASATAAKGRAARPQ